MVVRSMNIIISPPTDGNFEGVCYFSQVLLICSTIIMHGTHIWEGQICCTSFMDTSSSMQN